MGKLNPNVIRMASIRWHLSSLSIIVVSFPIQANNTISAGKKLIFTKKDDGENVRKVNRKNRKEGIN